MRLQRLRVTELRQFRQPFELSGLDPGLNLFTGPNESGKSTLVRAIRAAFVERHRSTSVEDLRPYGDSAATPSIELDFMIDGELHRLSKSFLQKKRCELLIGATGARRLEGVEAEDHLAERLGYQFAQKGGTRLDLLGVPGLLWIEQGSAQHLREAVQWASAHLRGALEGASATDDATGDLAATGGDAVIEAVRQRRDDLLTKAGKPRHAYQAAGEAVDELDRQITDLEAQIQTYRHQVDRLAQLRETHATDESTTPWAALRTEQAKAEEALSAVKTLGAELTRERDNLQQRNGLRELLIDRLQRHAADKQALIQREQALTATVQKHDGLQERTRAFQLERDQAQQRLSAARAACTLARQEESRRVLSRQRTEAQERGQELLAKLTQARAQEERAAALRREATLLRIEPTDLARLREQHQGLLKLAIEQQAVATRLRFELMPGATLALGAEALAGGGERLLLEPTTLAIPGVGELQISPGGSDLAELVQRRAELEQAHRALLQRLGLPDMAAAEARAQSHAGAVADAASAVKAVELLAPKGLAALQAELDQVQAREREAAAGLEQLALLLAPVVASAPESNLPTALTLAEAELALEAAQAQADAIGAQLQAAQAALTAVVGQRQDAQRERDVLGQALQDPALLADIAAWQRDLAESQVQTTALQARIAELEARLQQARPEILAQDVERLRRSADAALETQRARALEIRGLEAELASAGRSGLEEQLALRQAEQVLARRRLEELRRQAVAADYLLERLLSRRQALTRRLQAPLQRHLDRYLQLMLPQGRLEVSEDLAPGALVRPGSRGPESVDVDTLSFGAREQMGVISRLAYADLLKEAGRPTLIILDDALVHSDAQRLAQMKRAIFDASQRHQVLVFTCHPQAWRDLGVTPRTLEAR